MELRVTSCKLQKSTWETKNMYIMHVSASVAELRAQTFASGHYKAICCRICCSHEAQDFAVDLSGTFWCSKGLQRSSEMCDIIVIVGTPQYTMLLTLFFYIYVNINCWQISSRLFQNLKCKVSILKGHKRIPHFLTSVSQSFFRLDSGNSILKIIDVRIKKKCKGHFIAYIIWTGCRCNKTPSLTQQGECRVTVHKHIKP